MHSISLIWIGVLLALCCCPHTLTATTTAEPMEVEEPKTLPLTDAKTAVAAEDTSSFRREVWQEDDREVLIRNERGTKDNGSGSTSGKKQKQDTSTRKDKHTQKQKQQQQHSNKTPDTNPDSSANTTQETVKKHQHHQQKHEKNSHNNKKHAQSTEKPKQKDESKGI
jgi:hypothetical protein